MKTHRLWLSLAALVVFFHAMLAYGWPTRVLLGLLAGFAALLAAFGARAALTVALSTAVSTGVLALAVSWLGLVDRVYFRPHEMLAVYDDDRDHRIYEPNAQVTMDGVRGDLQAMTGVGLDTPARTIVFRTDADGFRNDDGYRGQTHLAVGDSFVVGNGTTQSDTLTAQLLRDYGHDVYNLAFAATPSGYERMVDAFSKRYGHTARILLFLFEGNDFKEIPEMQPATPRHPASRIAARYLGVFSGTALYRVVKSLFYPGRRNGDPERVRVATTDKGPIAFLESYVEAARSADAPRDERLEKILRRLGPRLDAVFFIPTKYRVYARHLDGDPPPPHAHWAHLAGLCDRQHLRCVDLTPGLRERADALFEEGRWTFWPDDSHWSAEGIAVAAAAVDRVLSADARGH